MSSRLQGNRSIDVQWLRAHLAELVLFCVAISCLFIKLGIGEIESHDEALYVVRAIAVLKFDAWLDQSAYSLGGFYSGTHPPIGVWLIAISRTLFGESELATRLPAAFAGVAAALGMYQLLKLWVNDRIAILLAASFTVCTLFLWYGRHAQLDSLLIALSIWTVVMFQRSLEERSNRYAIAAGLILGVALMSKFIWALFVVPFLVLLVIDCKNAKRVTSLLIAITIALIVALPWHIYMLSTHADFLQHLRDSLIGLSTVENYEPGGARSILYYLNQLLVNCPFIIAALWIPFRKELRANRMIWLTSAWLALLLIVLQLASTKMPHFALVLLPVGYLLSGLVIHSVKQPPKSFWLMLSLAVLWSLSLQFRMIVKGAEFDLVTPDLMVMASCFAVVIALAVLSWTSRRELRSVMVISLAGLFVMTSATKVISYSEDVFTDGAKQIALTVNRHQVTELTVLHTSLPHDEQTPRLAFYTDGWTEGWISGKTSTKIAWDRDDVYARLMHFEPGNSAVVIERDWDRFYRPTSAIVRRMDSIKSLLHSRYSKYDSLRSYDLFYN